MAPVHHDAATGGLRLHRLTYLEDRGEVTVGRPDAGSYVVLPPDGAALLRRLEAGEPPAEAALWYERTYSEQIDIADFVSAIDELGFLRHDDDLAIRDPGPVRWQRLGQAVFSRAALVCYLILLGAAIAAMWHSPRLMPEPHNFFFIHYMSVLVPAVFVGQLPLILLHEASHALAGRRLGLPTRLSIGRRLHYVVFQTTMDGLVAVPPRQRILPILAGMLTDLGVVAALTLMAAALPTGGVPGLLGRFALSLAFLSVLRIAWQGWFFLQTDIYYLVVTVLGCVNLQATAKQVLRNWLDRRLGRQITHDPQQWHPRDRRAARWYSVLIAVGYGFMLLTVVTFVLPMVGRLVVIVFGRLTGNHAQGGGGLLDSAIFLLFTLSELGLAATMAYRQYRSKRA